MHVAVPVVDGFDLHVEELQGLIIGDTNFISPPTYFAHERTKRAGIRFQLQIDASVFWRPRWVDLFVSEAGV
jgi:hypothetical protein